jgi:hypothetical protein
MWGSHIGQALPLAGGHLPWRNVLSHAPGASSRFGSKHLVSSRPLSALTGGEEALLLLNNTPQNTPILTVKHLKPAQASRQEAEGIMAYSHFGCYTS